MKRRMTDYFICAFIPSFFISHTVFVKTLILNNFFYYVNRICLWKLSSHHILLLFFSLSSSDDGYIWSVRKIRASEYFQSLFQQLIESSISTSPYSAWRWFCHLGVSEGRTSRRVWTPRCYTFFSQTIPAHHFRLPPRERTATTMVLSQRQRDELWVTGCKYVVVVTRHANMTHHIEQLVRFSLGGQFVCMLFYSNTLKFPHMWTSSLDRKWFNAVVRMWIP